MQLRFILIVLGIFILAGCQQDNRENALEEKSTSDRIIHVENTNQTQLKNYSNSEIANHLANVAASVPDVYGAAAIVAGPYAVVGIDVDQDLDRTRVGTLKYSVSEALSHDPYGKTAVVVADGDVLKRIRDMNDKIKQGYPVQAVVDELAAIVGRYMPYLPPPEDQPKDSDQNKDVLPKDEEKELDDIQEKQSNDMMNKKE